MRATLDVYAMTNPALCSFVLAAFFNGFQEAREPSAELPLAYLPIPITLSSRLLDTFVGTNRRTGLIEWLHRSPEVVVRFDQRVRRTRNYSRDGLLFGVRYGILAAPQNGRFIASPVGERLLRSRSVDPSVRKTLSAAQRLGSWVAEIESTATVFHSFGIRL
jgi:hypothetical protein